MVGGADLGALFWALALSFRPRAYQIVPLVMALRQDIVRLLIADDVGVGKTVEALLVLREMMERARVSRFAVICLPHLCDQWQQELRAKLGIEAVIIRSNTQARLDRMIQGDTSVYDYYPYQIISIDYIKADSRRAVFVEQSPELIIVDEVHTCARPAGASKAQQQRYHLLRDLADKADQHLVLLTATPHTKPEEFHSRWGAQVRLQRARLGPNSSRPIAALGQALRPTANAPSWRVMGEDNTFPRPGHHRWEHDLSPAYAELFNDVSGCAAGSARLGLERKKRVHYWTALGLLRGVMSSPGAGVKMLATRLDQLVKVEAEDAVADEEGAAVNPVGDVEVGVETDIAPTQVMEQGDWSDHQRRQLRSFSRRLEAFAGTDVDQKLSTQPRLYWRTGSPAASIPWCSAAISKLPTMWASTSLRC